MADLGPLAPLQILKSAFALFSGVLRDLLHFPSPDALREFLALHLQARECLVQVAGECEIFYSGRAQSFADAGDYLVLVECDGSVQVHGAQGYKPRNWQAKTDELSVELEDGRVVLSAWRYKPEELVRVVFLEVSLALALAMQAENGFVLQGTEAQMRAALGRHPEIIEPGLTVLHEELPVGVGGVDLYARDACGRYVVVELKRSKATQEAVHQISRYVEAIQPTVQAPVRGILAAPDITQPAMARLNQAGLEFVKVTALPKAPEESSQPSLF